MRVVFGAACLVSGATILQGCGGGGGGTTTPAPAPVPSGPVAPVPPAGDKACVGTKFEVVTGGSTSNTKISATVTGAMPGTTDPKIVIPVEGGSTGSVKMDMEKFTYHFEQTTNMKATGEVLGSKSEATGTAKYKSIFDASKKTMVTWYDAKASATFMGKTHPVAAKHCTVTTYASITVAEIAAQWAMIKPIMQENVKCSGNDGTVDQWQAEFHHKADEPMPPGVPLPPFNGNLNIKADVTMDKDNLWKGAYTTVSGDGEYEETPVSMKMSTSTAFTDSTTTGPTPEDLDYSSWVGCDKVTATTFDLHTQLFDKQVGAFGQQESITLAMTSMLSAMKASRAKEIVV